MTEGAGGVEGPAKDPIVVCVPWVKPNPRHMEHFIEWYAINMARHNLKRVRIFWRALHQAQARARELAKQFGASHILFTEDDQWGYPVDGLETLLEADRDVIGFRTYFKKYPYLSMAFRQKDPSLSLIGRVPNFNQLELPEGIGMGKQDDLPDFWRVEGASSDDPIEEVDLLSWAFTLVKMSVFDRMEEAGYDPFVQWGPNPTDSFFCEYCKRLDIKRYVHFGATIGHGDIGPDEIPHYRRLHESINAAQYTRAMKLVLEDDHGQTYGQAEYLPEAAKAIKEYAEGAQDGPKNPPLAPEEEMEECSALYAPPGDQRFSVVRERKQGVSK